MDVRTSVSAVASSESKIYLCKRYEGHRFWASKPCHRHSKALLEREVRVPADMTWKQQLAYARKVRAEADALQVPPRAPQGAFNRKGKAPNCERFQQALERNASAARTGGSARYMDRLNDERRGLFAEKWRAGC